MIMKVKEVIKMLEADGWQMVRMSGDHRIFRKEGAKRPNVIPGKLSDDVPIKTLYSIMKTMKDN